ncbi:MAG: multiheme c-type cytochrome, partial [Planctomycetota bacterium]
MKNVLLPFIIILVALASFGLWVVLTAPDVQLDEPDRESPTTETVPSEYHPTKLSQEESAYGFQTMVDPQRNVTTLVHPNSPCWLELPNPSTAPSQDAAPKATDFVGPESCAKCHPKQYEGFVETAHASTSSLASQETIDGPFSASNNKITTVHPDLTFQMLREGEQHFQQIQFRQLSRKVPFDIVTGSGKSAQTYLFWEEDRLYQMHMSYFKPLQSWINSPGYHEGTAWFTRETIPKCVQCHMTYMEWKPGTANAYVKAATIFGVSCERCHGPARAHVEHHEQNPSDKTARHIANPSKLEPERANDVCAQCHLGTAQPLQAPFSFRPGDELSAHFHVFPEEEGKGQVHTSNQLQRMKLSKCFLESERMT